MLQHTLAEDLKTLPKKLFGGARPKSSKDPLRRLSEHSHRAFRRMFDGMASKKTIFLVMHPHA